MINLVKAVFVDRDGTINPDLHYLSDSKRFKLYDGVGSGFKRLVNKGYKIIVITNQSGLARGLISLEQLSEIHDKMEADLSDFGVRLGGIYFCPHLPNDRCDCRKPNIGLFKKAEKNYDIDKSKSCMVGDSLIDIEAGRKYGVKTIQISSSGSGSNADFVAKNMESAVDWIIENT